MATLVTVHGTFAHMNEGLQPDGRVLDDHLWWHKDSTFERTMHRPPPRQPEPARQRHIVRPRRLALFLC